MAETQTGARPPESKQGDPFDVFRQMRDTYMDVMSKSMVEAVNTEAYAKSTGALLESTLSVAAPMRQAMDQSMVQALEQLSLPSRDDLMRLADRFTNMEMRLDEIDAQLGRIEKAIQPPPARVAPEPVVQADPDLPLRQSPETVPAVSQPRANAQMHKRKARSGAARQKA